MTPQGHFYKLKQQCILFKFEIYMYIIHAHVLKNQKVYRFLSH